jgi:hypothetical protein
MGWLWTQFKALVAVYLAVFILAIEAGLVLLMVAVPFMLLMVIVEAMK